MKCQQAKLVCISKGQAEPWRDNVGAKRRLPEGRGKRVKSGGVSFLLFKTSLMLRFDHNCNRGNSC